MNEDGGTYDYWVGTRTACVENGVEIPDIPGLEVTSVNRAEQQTNPLDRRAVPGAGHIGVQGAFDALPPTLQQLPAANYAAYSI